MGGPRNILLRPRQRPTHIHLHSITYQIFVLFSRGHEAFYPQEPYIRSCMHSGPEACGPSPGDLHVGISRRLATGAGERRVGLYSY